MDTSCIILIVCLLVNSAGGKYGGGSGTAEDPYRIATAADLIALGETPDDYDQHFILTADIDLDPNLPGRQIFARAVIAPDTDPYKLDYQGTPFIGAFDGRAHAIRNMTIIGQEYLGLFGRIGSGAEIKRLGLEAVEVHGTGFYASGLVGRNTHGSIVASYSTGSVSGNSDIGGLVGCNEYGRIAASHSSSSVSGTGWGVGGLVGVNYTGQITSSYSTGSVGGTGSGVGGLVGDNEGNVTASYACGAVSGKYYVGGVAGDNEGNILTSYSGGSVSGVYQYVGGLVGENAGSVNRSYSAGPVDGASKVGGLVGTQDFYGVESASFWDIEISGQSASKGGTGKTTAEMQTAATFLEAGWECAGETVGGTEGMWTFVEGNDYPRLQWEYRAFCPDPNDGALDVPPPVTLSWIVGSRALVCDIYFGEDPMAVGNATPESDDVYLGRQAAGTTAVDLGILDWGETYYWRIDQLNQVDPDSPWKGSVWSFTLQDRGNGTGLDRQR